MNEKQKIVYDILLCPVFCIKDYHGIDVFKDADGNNVIVSGQKYISDVSDEDMSDFTVGYYDILYRNVLNSIHFTSILDEHGYLVSREFAGDSINSFTSIATVGLGPNWKFNVSPAQWPDYLSEYHKRYHCLANFWLIPMRHGRRGMKLSKYDSGRYYICRILNEYSKFSADKNIIYNKHKYKNYFRVVSKNDFLNLHHIDSDITDSSDLLALLSPYKKHNDSNCRELVSEAMKMLKNRACKIALDDEVSSGLYDYFAELGLIHRFSIC